MLENETALPDWQVQQAENAVAIYLQQFLKLDLSAVACYGTGNGTGTEGTHPLLTWPIAIEQTKADYAGATTPTAPSTSSGCVPAPGRGSIGAGPPR